MKKVAFILAIAFVFLVGEKIVFEHKVWAGEKVKSKKAFSIPVTENGEFDLQAIEDKQRVEFPINVEKWKTINNVQTAVIIRFENDPYCYLVCSGGSCVKKCVRH